MTNEDNPGSSGKTRGGSANHTETYNGQKPSLDSVIGRWSRGKSRESGLRRLARLLNEIDSRLDFKQSARGWCYTLEGERLIDKGEFNRAETAINDCRKLGLLPLDFCAEDEARRFDVVEEATDGTVEDHFRRELQYALRSAETFSPDWWLGERCYLQMLVEKVDLKSLFRPVCEQYHVPIANASGWADLNLRGDMAKRFLDAQRSGLQCVLLYCGDFDPWGLKIEVSLRKNLSELEAATGYDPADLVIDRFGLNSDFIVENQLTWIDNLETGSGKDMTRSHYCYNCEVQHPDGSLRCSNCQRKLYVQPDFVLDYITKYGVRKCEANALVKVPRHGRELAKEAIQRYLGQGSLSRFAAKRNMVRSEFEGLEEQYPELFLQMKAIAWEGYQ